MDSTFVVEDQKRARVDWCKFMLEKLDARASKKVINIIASEESWIYKQQSRVWVFENKEKPTEVVGGKSANKKIISCFFRRSGPVTVIPLEDRKTVIAKWYTDVCLSQVFQKLRSDRRKSSFRGICYITITPHRLPPRKL